ncbi:uncharacterized protein TNCV_3995931 [Trichonephila clavipes]|nr:uncharacterized protein TNCV_3995931 [Trichonephila clavipes]
MVNKDIEFVQRLKNIIDAHSDEENEINAAPVPMLSEIRIIRRAASSLVRLVEGERGGRPRTTPGVLPQNWGGNQPDRTVTCVVLQATDNDRRHLALCHDEFRGPSSDLCRSGGISNNNSTSI